MAATAGEIDLGPWPGLFRRIWWKAALLSVALGAATLLALLRVPNLYRARAVIAPVTEDAKQAPNLGALAALGIAAGAPAKVEDLDTLFNSDDLTVRVFRKHALWPIVYGDTYDPRTGSARPGWLSRAAGGGKTPQPPGDWDAIRAARSGLSIAVNKRSGVLHIAFESSSADGSAEIVGYYLDEGKSRLQEEALQRANRNKQFIAEQIGKTVDPLTRDRLYALYGQEVEREMLARNREQFGFRVVDTPRAPDRKSGPKRARTAVLVTVLSFPLAAILFGLAPGRRRE